MGCQVLKACMQDLAAQYKYVKFLTILSTECIPNYPDENLPTLLVYHDGQCKRTIVGTRSLGIDRISPESEHPSFGLSSENRWCPCLLGFRAADEHSRMLLVGHVSECKRTIVGTGSSMCTAFFLKLRIPPWNCHVNKLQTWPRYPAALILTCRS